MKKTALTASLVPALLAAFAMLAATSVPAGADDFASPSPSAQEQAPRQYPFEPHARFYSEIVARTPAIDPQVFVKDESAAAGTGPQGIPHAKGFRPATLGDAPETRIYGADGADMLLTLGKWLGATGSARIEERGPDDRVSTSFANLIPFGVYSLFKIVFASDGATFTPLDGNGTRTGFEAGADGTAHFTVVAPGHFAPGNAIVLVYHSDALDHGESRGDLGITAHEELIVRLPQ